MEELLNNIDYLVTNHFKLKTKKVRYYDDETEENVQSIIDKLTEDLYDYCDEALRDADREIDTLIEEMEIQHQEDVDNNPWYRKDFNVFMLKHKDRGEVE